MPLSDGSGVSPDLLRSFLLVAEHQNISKAAPAIGRTQSAVSLQIARLERELGVELFERHAHGMRLTESGETLMPMAQQSLEGLNQIGALFAEPVKQPIRVGIPDDYAGPVLERILASFRGSYPSIEVRATCGCTGNYSEMVAADELDLAVVSVPPEAADKAFFEEPMVWAAHRELEIDPSEAVPLVLFDRECWWSSVPADALKAAGRAWRAAYRSESHPGVRAAVSAGLGVGILPESALVESLVARSELPTLPSSSLVFLRNDLSDQPLVDSLIEAVREAFSSPFSV